MVFVTLNMSGDDVLTTEWACLHGTPRGKEDKRLLPELAHWIKAALRERVGQPPAGVPAGPPFFHACWRACRRIKIDRTKTYAQLATAAGRPTAVRAAGGAMRANPQPLLTPCHRVLGTAGLGGFHGTKKRGKALALKADLLSIEAALADTIRSSPR
ncbi:MAG: MGMT family protein [Phycisphaerales bacterium]|nr:MGMT family protein [Phycisphaerales bacterium]